VRRPVVAGLALAVGVLAAGCRSSADPPAAAPAPAALTADAEPPPVTQVVPAPTEAPPASTAPPPSAAPSTAAPPRQAAGPPPPASPAALADELVRVEREVRDPATAAAALPALGLAQQVAYRQLAANPSWRPQVLAAVPKALQTTIVANADAEVRLASMHVKRPTTFPAWRIVAPPPPDVVLAAHQAASRQIGVPWEALAAIHLVETRMGRIRGTSTAGAKGPMQFLPATWTQYGAGGSIEDLEDASKAAARLLKRNGFDRSPRDAVWSYNHSQAYVDAVLAYTSVMQADGRAFYGYHGWQVFYRHAEGDALLHEGWTGPGVTP
jgi:membrane-bound lytic murein transglycosylase B